MPSVNGTMAESVRAKLAPETEGIPAACCTLDLDGEPQERFLAMCKALGNPHRFEILKFLITHPGCITGSIVDHLPIAQSTTSQHLKVLKEAGWICGTVDGPATSYCLDLERVAWFKGIVGEIF